MDNATAVTPRNIHRLRTRVPRLVEQVDSTLSKVNRLSEQNRYLTFLDQTPLQRVGFLLLRPCLFARIAETKG